MAAVGADAVVSASPIEAVGAPGWTEKTVARSTIAAALVVTLLLSRLPEIVARELLAIDVPGISWISVALAVVLWLASRSIDALRPLERFLAVMIGVTVTLAALPVVLESSVWTGIVPLTTQPIVALLATRVLYGVVALILLGLALGLGASRGELYLGVGDLDAPTRRRRNSGEPVRWRRFGLLAFIGLVLLMFWFGFPIVPAQFDLAAAAPFIALGAAAALLNAFWEEVAFRAVPLSMLQRAVGPGVGVLLLALWFGLGHFYGGIPSGVMGLVATGAVAILLGRAMIETRGLGWPIALHFAIDVVIFTFLAIASVA